MEDCSGELSTLLLCETLVCMLPSTLLKESLSYSLDDMSYFLHQRIAFSIQNLMKR